MLFESIDSAVGLPGLKERSERTEESPAQQTWQKSSQSLQFYPVTIFGLATASNERALANARAASVECSRRRLERAEVAQAVAELTAAYGRRPVPLPQSPRSDTR